MSSQTAETAKLLSTVFVEEVVKSSATGLGLITSALTVVTLWAWLGERFTSFDLNRRCLRRYE